MQCDLAPLRWILGQEFPEATHVVRLSRQRGVHGELFGLDLDENGRVHRVLPSYSAEAAGVLRGDHILASHAMQLTEQLEFVLDTVSRSHLYLLLKRDGAPRLAGAAQRVLPSKASQRAAEC